MKLIPIIQKINRIKKDISENQTLISTILPVFRYLNWDIFNENRVIFEDVTSTKKRVDLTLISEDNSKFIIEAKRLSHKLSIKDFEQLTVYLNSDDSVNFGILTNGIDYWIADNKGEGLDGKKIYGFNIFDITECDLTILKLFFSFNPSYKLKDLKRYINYIKTGVYFGDKKCIKILEIKDFEIDKEIKSKSIKELQVEKNITKPQFEQLNILDLDEVDKKKDEPKKIEKNKDSEDIKEREDIEDIEDIKTTPVSSDKQTDKIDFSSDLKVEKPSPENSVEVFKAEDGEIEFFELIERNKAKIYINGEYHILKDNSFSSLFIQIIKYTLQKVESYPTLFNKIVDEFSFIVKNSERNIKSAKYELLSNDYYFNININNYTKLKNIEAILKFIDKHSE